MVELKSWVIGSKAGEGGRGHHTLKKGSEEPYFTRTGFKIYAGMISDSSLAGLWRFWEILEE